MEPEDNSEDGFSADELRQEKARRIVAKRALKATHLADTVGTLIALSAVVMIIAGVALALSTETGFSGSPEHTHVAVGVGLIVGAVIQACFGLMVSHGISTVTRYVYYRTEFDYFD
jgi:hypothetical protein